MMLLGYFLGSAIPNVDKHMHIVIAIVVVLSLLPAIIETIGSAGGNPAGLRASKRRIWLDRSTGLVASRFEYYDAFKMGLSEMIAATQIKRGMAIKLNGELYRVFSFQHITPGNWRGMVQTKLKSIKSGSIIEHRFRSEDRVEQAYLETHEVEYLYSDGSDYYFMNTTSFEQFHLPSDLLEDAIPFMMPNIKLQIEASRSVRWFRRCFQRKVTPPFLLRFPQILDTQVKEMHEAFRSSIAEYNYGARHRGVFPMKVNQNRSVVERLLAAGHRYEYGLEVGTKAELAAALTLPIHPNALLVCNGVKDRRYLEWALQSSKLGKNPVLVLEEFGY